MEIDLHQDLAQHRSHPELTPIQLAVLQGDEISVVTLVQRGGGVDLNQQTAKDLQIVYTVCNQCVCEEVKERSYNTARVFSRSDCTVMDESTSDSSNNDTDTDQKMLQRVGDIQILTATDDPLTKSLLLLKGTNVVSQTVTSSLSNTISVVFCCRTDCKHDLVEEGRNNDVGTRLEVCKGSTVLHLAALMNNSKMADLLLTLGARLDLENSQSHTVLHLAAKLDNVEMIKSLAKRNNMKNLLNVINSNRDRPVHTAVKYSSVNVLKYLLRETPPVTQASAMVNRYGKHPVHIAIQNNNVEALKLLLLSSGGKLGNTEVREDYHPPACLSNALHFAIIHNSPDCGQVLIDSGYDVNARDSSNTPLLRIASRFGLHRMTSLLLQNGAKVHDDMVSTTTRSSGQEQGQQSALDTALEMTYLDQMLTLMSAGATFDSKRSANAGWAVEQMDMKLCLSCDDNDNREAAKKKFLKLLSFGYRFSATVLSLATCREEEERHSTSTVPHKLHPWDDIVQLILRFSKNPLPLQRLAANRTIRTLRPNAWVSVKQLPLPHVLLGYIVQYQYSWE